MKIEIDRGYEKIVERLIQTGRYASEQEVIQAGIAQLAVDAIDPDDEEIDDATAASIERSEADIAAGRIQTLESARIALIATHFPK